MVVNEEKQNTSALRFRVSLTSGQRIPQENLKGASVASPWNENLLKVQHDSVPLEKEQAKLFHTVTVQGLFLCKCGHLDIAPAIAYLTTWVQKPNCTDWTKLC